MTHEMSHCPTTFYRSRLGLNARMRLCKWYVRFPEARRHWTRSSKKVGRRTDAIALDRGTNLTKAGRPSRW
jgi:hypothetical protein